MSISAPFKRSEVDLINLNMLKVLLVEDDVLNAKLLSILFLQKGLSLDVAINGEAAIDKIKENDYNLVLMDMEMPVLNGYQATAIIRQQLKNTIPIIALTANSSSGEREKCLQLGMNGYLLKPVDADILFDTIHNVTNGATIVLTKTSTIKTFGTPAVSSKVCDMAYLNNVSRGNKKIIKNIVAEFFKETRKELVYLNDAIEKTNYTVINDISHKIKSAFSILGISVLEPVFKEMEQLSSVASTPIEKIEKLNRTINIVFKQARAEMKAMV